MKRLFKLLGQTAGFLILGLTLGAAAHGATFTVNLTTDNGDGTCDATCTLRDAILAANAQAGDDVIEFDQTIFATAQTITLGGAELSVANNGSLTINGSGALRLSISGNQQSRVFRVVIGANLSLNALTVTGGRIATGNLSDNGGGILNNGDTLTITNSTVSGNYAAQRGGGIYNAYGTVNLTNSTVSGNYAANTGGIWNIGTANLTNSTVSDNYADGGNPGGIMNLGTLRARNTIIFRNQGGSLLGDMFAFAVNENNIISDRIGFRLAPLGFYGGATQTHALLSGTSAINAGNNCVLTQSCATFNAPIALTTDQRGAPRNGNVDIGAFELQPDTDGDGVDDFADNCPSTFNPENIAFASDRNGNYEIYVANADGSNPTRLTNNPASDYSPSFSFNGAQIAFTSERDGNGEIYVMNADGSNPTRLTNHAGYDSLPRFSPDGSKITFQSYRDGNAEVYVMNSDGSNQINLTNNGNPDYEPTFSPDGSKIAFRSPRSGGQEDIYLINSDGSGNLINLTNHGSHDVMPSFSPDGSKIVFVSLRDGNAEVYVMNSNGSNQTRLTNHGAIDFRPSFSPDGSKIIFDSFRDGNNEIYMINADGSNPINLTNTTATEFFSSWGRQADADGDGIGDACESRLNTFTTIIPDVIYVGDATSVTGYNFMDQFGNPYTPAQLEVQILNAETMQLENTQTVQIGGSGQATVQFLPFTTTGNKIYRFIAENVVIDRPFTVLSNDSDGDGVYNYIDNCPQVPNPDQADSNNNGIGDACEDSTPPVITPSVSGTLGNNGWYVSDIQVSWSVTDGETSISNQTGCDTQTVTADTSGITFTCQATSIGGTNSQSVTVKRDVTAPSITFDSRTATNANGWNNTNVGVLWNCADTMSGAAASSVSQTLMTEGANQTATGTCADNAGNTAQNTQGGINIDKTAPTISLYSRTAPNANGWNNTNVEVIWNCADALSGTVSSSVNQTLMNEGANQSSTGICTDLAGNLASNTQGSINIDKTAPTITLDSRTPAANTAGWNNSAVQVNWNCTDSLSGAVNSSFSQSVSGEGANQSAVGTCTDNAGNTAQNSQSGINIDMTAPTITFDSRTPAANASGWNNSDVTINWSCADTLSGAVNQTISQTLDTEGASQSSNGTCTDLAGNTASNTQGGINIDKTAPTISFDSRTPTANANGWNNTSVQVNWSCADTLSGAVSSSVNQTVSSEGSNQSLTGTCTDIAGNTVQDTQSGINIDTTAPVITFDARTVPNSNGWNNTNVQVNWNCSDALSGAANPSVNQSLTTEGANQSSTGTCTDNAGNTISDTQSGINIDKTVPVITFDSRTAPNAAGWNNSNVIVNWNCSDVLSGAVSPSISQTLMTEGANQSSNGTCTDNAGNTAQNTQSGISIDKTAPTLAPAVAPNPVLLGGSAIASSNAADSLSGIANQSCGAVNTATVGSKTVSCSATDIAGNTVSANAGYRVVYNFAGFFQPIDNLPTVNIVNAGQSIPIKFSLNGYQGLAIFAAGYPASGMVPCSANEPGSTVEEVATPGSSGLSYTIGSDQYSYVWKTDKSWKGTCRILVVRFVDGSEYYAKFRFK